jgi:membrane protease YdiL (CAAX protease family)
MNEINDKLKQITFFSQSAQSKLKINIFTIVIIYFLLWLSGFFIGRLIANVVVDILIRKVTSDESLIYAVRRVIACGIQIAEFFLWVHYIEKRPIRTMGLQTTGKLKNYLVGALIGIISVSVITIILFLQGMIAFKSYNAFEPLILGLIALGWVVQSASEEIAVRGWLIPMLGDRSNLITAIVLTSIIFGILHLFSSGVTVISFVNLIFSGVFFAAYAIYSNNIWGVCGLHFSWNLTLANIYGLPVSGFVSNGQTVFTVEEIGNIIFTGGAFGPEGGIVTTIILLLGVGIVVFMLNRKYIKNSKV